MASHGRGRASHLHLGQPRVRLRLGQPVDGGFEGGERVSRKPRAVDPQDEALLGAQAGVRAASTAMARGDAPAMRFFSEKNERASEGACDLPDRTQGTSNGNGSVRSSCVLNSVPGQNAGYASTLASIVLLSNAVSSRPKIAGARQRKGEKGNTKRIHPPCIATKTRTDAAAHYVVAGQVQHHKALALRRVRVRRGPPLAAPAARELDQKVGRRLRRAGVALRRLHRGFERPSDRPQPRALHAHAHQPARPAAGWDDRPRANFVRRAGAQLVHRLRRRHCEGVSQPGVKRGNECAGEAERTRDHNVLLVGAAQAGGARVGAEEQPECEVPQRGTRQRQNAC